MALLIPASLGLVALVWAWIALAPSQRRAFAHRLERGDTPWPEDQAMPRVAIVCAGRNEGAHLERVLEGLCAQQYPCYDVVFVDDASSDDTPSITRRLAARHPHLTVVRNEAAPPDGWVGKPHALTVGMRRLEALEAERGEKAALVCFTDADIDWDPEALAEAVAKRAHEGADLLSIFPRLEMKTRAERLIMPAMVMGVNLLHPIEHAMDPRRADAVGAGAFLMLTRDTYDGIGGHGEVADRIVEDIALAQRVKQEGGRMWMGFTQTLLHCRMYEGFSDLWEGLTKNAYAAIAFKLWGAVLFVLGLLLCNVLPPLYAVGAALWWAWGGGALAAVSTGLAVIVLKMQWLAKERVRRFLQLSLCYTFTVPVSSSVIIGILVASTWAHYRGGNVWKGRRY